jgi:hypothetical protein
MDRHYGQTVTSPTRGQAVDLFAVHALQAGLKIDQLKHRAAGLERHQMGPHESPTPGMLDLAQLTSLMSVKCRDIYNVPSL